MEDRRSGLTLNELFRRSKGAPLDLDGRAVRLAIDLPVEQGVRGGVLQVLQHRESPVQGVSMSVRNGKLAVASEIAPRMTLWADTAPAEVPFEIVRRAGGPCVLRVWNSWRHGVEGEPQEWLDNAGVSVKQERDGRFLIECSDGWGAPDFGDLVVRLQLR